MAGEDTTTTTPSPMKGFWDKNKWYLVGGIGGGVLLLMIVIAMIVMAKKS